MNWSPVLEAFRTHLETAVATTPVSLGGEARIPEEDRVIILRGTTTQGDPRRAQDSAIKAWVECWAYAKDPDYAVGYALLAALEEKVADAVRTFGQDGGTVNGYQVRAELGEFEGDGDVFRPSVGSRCGVTIKMRNK